MFQHTSRYARGRSIHFIAAMVSIFDCTGGVTSIIIIQITIIALANSSDAITAYILACFICQEIAIVTDTAVVTGLEDEIGSSVAAFAGDDVQIILGLSAARVGQTVASGHIIASHTRAGVCHI